jgi:hypothetical protein
MAEPSQMVWVLLAELRVRVHCAEDCEEKTNKEKIAKMNDH